jgi:hypothetical protein
VLIVISVLVHHKLNVLPICPTPFNHPTDENHPERGYYYGTPEFNNQEFSMRFKLPEGLAGEEVLLQWWYVSNHVLNHSIVLMLQR